MLDKPLPPTSVHEHDPTPPPAPEEPQPKTLCDLADEFVFFTPALILQVGMFNKDPVAEYIATREVKEELRPVAIDSPRPFFGNLGASIIGGVEVRWAHRLYMVRKEGWQDCNAFLGSITLLDHANKRYTQFGWNEFPIIDPLSMEGAHTLTELPFVRVHAVCASTSGGFFYIAPAGDPPRTMPRVVREVARGDVVAMAIALLKPDRQR
jgi:hypothetical protein